MAAPNLTTIDMSVSNSLTSIECEKRKTKQNFSAEEVSIIIKMVEENVELLNSKFTNTVTNERKKGVWKRITARVNACDVSERSEKEVKDKWIGLQQNAKKEYQGIREERRTGGGPPPQGGDAITERIIALYGDTPTFTGTTGTETVCQMVFVWIAL